MATETQKKIAALMEADAKQATAMGYPDTGAILERRAAEYRAATGQTVTEEQPTTEAGSS